jgi:hypothetical protein
MSIDDCLHGHRNLKDKGIEWWQQGATVVAKMEDVEVVEEVVASL